jgi:endonuclease III related protein
MESAVLLGSIGQESTEAVRRIYDTLFGWFGPQGWWPAEDDFEMVVGAILTQSTAWANVVKAIDELRAAGALDVAAMAEASEERLALLVRGSGYFRQKARKLKAFVGYLGEHHDGSLRGLFHVKLPDIRGELLGIWGIGPETADSIILYGARQPIFVVDAYTRRIFSRLGLTPPDASYEQLQGLFRDHLVPSVPLFQEYHALLVALGKNVCRPRPLCGSCPLRDICPTSLRLTPLAPR